MLWVRRASGQAIAAAVGLAFLCPAAAQTEDGAGDQKGEGVVPPAAQVCLGCHNLDEAGRQGGGAAPPLRGVIGRSPSVDGVAAEQWDPELLDRWLANPRAVDPETDSRFPGYADAAMRQAVIRFLEGLE